MLPLSNLLYVAPGPSSGLILSVEIADTLRAGAFFCSSYSGALYVLCAKVFFFFFNYLFTYLFLAVLGLRFCARTFSSCGEWGPLFIAVREPLTIAASLAAEHRLQTRKLSSCGARA